MQQRKAIQKHFFPLSALVTNGAFRTLATVSLQLQMSDRLLCTPQTMCNSCPCSAQTLWPQKFRKNPYTVCHSGSGISEGAGGRGSIGVFPFSRDFGFYIAHNAGNRRRLVRLVVKRRYLMVH